MASKPNRCSIAEVVIPIPVDTPFSYFIPTDYENLIQPGVQVIVPFGERFVAGIVRKKYLPERLPERELKEIYDVVSPDPYIGKDLLALLEWISGYYICHLGEAYRLIYPSHNIIKSRMELRRIKGTTTQPELTPALRGVLEQLPEDQWIGVRELEKKLATSGLLYRISRLKANQLIETRYTLPKHKKIFRTIDVFSLRPMEEWDEAARNHYGAEGSRRYTRARNLIAFLREHQKPLTRAELQSAGFGTYLLRRLEQQGVLLRSTREIERSQEGSYRETERISQLFDEQRTFIEQVRPYLYPTPATKHFSCMASPAAAKPKSISNWFGRRSARAGRQLF